MAFSFNPGQSTQAGVPIQSPPPTSAPAPGSSAPGTIGAPQQINNQAPVKTAGGPSVPDSPFLFISQRGRGQDLSIGAYIQIVLIVLAILSVLASVILFTYSMYLTNSIESKKAELIVMDASFKEYPLDEMKKISDRFATLSDILREYVSVRSPLKVLEDVVENQVVVSGFILGKNIEGKFVMDFTIVTSNYKVLIQQLDALNLSQYTKVVPQAKVGGITDNQQTIKVAITAPVFVQGLLSEEVEAQLLLTVSSTSRQSISSSTTP
jgi:hypothetical protein